MGSFTQLLRNLTGPAAFPSLATSVLLYSFKEKRFSLKGKLSRPTCEIMRGAKAFKPSFGCLSLMCCSPLSVPDAQNAFKVRLSIKTALGENAVSTTASLPCPALPCSCPRRAGAGTLLKTAQAVSCEVSAGVACPGHDPGSHIES